MLDSELILLTGAAGKTGQQVLRALVTRKVQVRAFVRREEQISSMQSLGAEDVIIGDLYDAQSLKQALQGCTQIVHICPPMDPKEIEIAQTMVELSASENVRRFILYSVLHPLLEDVPHHYRKLQAERALVNSNLNYTILQPARYMQHLLPIWQSVVETGIHAMPFSIRSRFCVVDLADVAEAVAVVVTEEGHEHSSYQLAGPENLNQVNMAKILSGLLDRNIIAQKKSPEDFLEQAAKAGMSEARIENFRLMNTHYDQHGMTGNPNILSWLLGREPTCFADFVKRQFLS